MRATSSRGGRRLRILVADHRDDHRLALLTNSGSSPLPIIQTKVPIAGFYWAAPAILLALYCYLHLYLQRLWEGMANLPAIFLDGRKLDEWRLSVAAVGHRAQARTAPQG